jgi:hypothetical protein
MNEQTKATEPSDAELRALWQQAGGTIYANNREIGAMPTRELLPFLRKLLGPAAVVIRETDEATLQKLIDARHSAAPVQVVAAPSPALPDSGYAATLMKLIDAVCPGLDTGNLFEDARKAMEAMEHADLVGHFGIDDEPATDGSARYLMVGAQHAGDPDVFPLYRRAPRTDEAGEAMRATTAAPATLAKARAAAKKTAGGA